MIPATEALDRLKEGNLRFASGHPTHVAGADSVRRWQLLSGQSPFAIVLGCSDARVPPEIIFDQEIGELFVIRVAGNIAAPSPVASVEFAADHFEVPLVVVLGHSGCGAVAETLHEPDASADVSDDLTSLIKCIRASTDTLLGTKLRETPDELYRRAVRANVSTCAEHLRHKSKPLAPRVESGELLVVGAEYSLESGVVDFFDGIR
jgi:carbonic anhydrase